MTQSLTSGPQRRRSSGVTIAVIIGLTLVSLACIAASTFLIYEFLQTPPW